MLELRAVANVFDRLYGSGRLARLAKACRRRGLVEIVLAGPLLERGLRVSERVDAGMVGLNTGVFSDPAAPFGGTRQSGIGREGGHHGIHEFLETKYIAANW